MTTKPTPYEIASGMDESVCAARSFAHAIRLMAEGHDNADDNNAFQRVVTELERYLNEIEESRAPPLVVVRDGSRDRHGCGLTVMCREAKPHTPLKPSAKRSSAPAPIQFGHLVPFLRLAAIWSPLILTSCNANLCPYGRHVACR